MSRVKFGEFITVNKQVYKICPECRTQIPPEWEHAYENEWCPQCGLNIMEGKAKKSKPIKE